MSQCPQCNGEIDFLKGPVFECPHCRLAFQVKREVRPWWVWMIDILVFIPMGIGLVVLMKIVTLKYPWYYWWTPIVPTILLFIAMAWLHRFSKWEEMKKPSQQGNPADAATDRPPR